MRLLCALIREPETELLTSDMCCVFRVIPQSGRYLGLTQIMWGAFS